MINPARIDDRDGWIQVMLAEQVNATGTYIANSQNGALDNFTLNVQVPLHQVRRVIGLVVVTLTFRRQGQIHAAQHGRGKNWTGLGDSYKWLVSRGRRCPYARSNHVMEEPKAAANRCLVIFGRVVSETEARVPVSF